jgi:hypothetical protein
MLEMWLHESRRRSPLQLVQTLRLQNGPSLPLDWQLCRPLHLEAILAVFDLRDLCMLLHRRLDVYGCKEKTNASHILDCINAKFSAQVYAHYEVLH